MENLFRSCNKLTSLDVSNWDTSNVTIMKYMFHNCYKLIQLDVSNFNTSKVTTMQSMFEKCNNLTQLDVSNFNTSNVKNMGYMFYNCKNLTSLDVSSWDTSNVTNMSYMFDNTSKLSDIGMLYCSQSTINTIASVLPTTHTQTIWVKDTDINKLTSVSGVEFKEYKENGYMINLSSPLLDGDRIEVVDGNLCHYHKMVSRVLDGSEDWKGDSGFSNARTWRFYPLPGSEFASYMQSTPYSLAYSDNLPYVNYTKLYNNEMRGVSVSVNGNINIRNMISSSVQDFKQWLQQNPTTIIYELAQPYYEDITPLQSDIVLETYLECNMDIYTDLPIKANVSYITNVPSLSTLSMRATEMKESDNIIANLTNMLDNEINE